MKKLLSDFVIVIDFGFSCETSVSEVLNLICIHTCLKDKSGVDKIIVEKQPYPTAEHQSFDLSKFSSLKLS